MTIREIENKLKSKENELNFWITKKNIALESTLPKTIDYSKEVVDGGLRVDKYKHLDQSIDEIDPIIEALNLEIQALKRFLDKELILQGKYHPKLRKIIELRENEEYIKKYGRPMEFWKIGQNVDLARETCSRLYNRYYAKREYFEENYTNVTPTSQKSR